MSHSTLTSSRPSRAAKTAAQEMIAEYVSEAQKLKTLPKTELAQLDSWLEKDEQAKEQETKETKGMSFDVEVNHLDVEPDEYLGY